MGRPNRKLPGSMRARFVGVVLGLAWLSGCVGASASPSAMPSGSGAPLPPSVCPVIDLRSPTGQHIELTGRWRSFDAGTYYVRQWGSCVWITGFSVDAGAPGREGTSAYANAFFGNLASDFTASGFWADMPWGSEDGVGTVTWKIDFADIGGEESMTLNAVEVSGEVHLSLVEPRDAREDLRLRLQDTDSCALAGSDDGDDYQIVVAAPGWAFMTPAHLVGPNGALIQPSDVFDVSGEVAGGIGPCGPGLIFFADQVEPVSTP